MLLCFLGGWSFCCWPLYEGIRPWPLLGHQVGGVLKSTRLHCSTNVPNCSIHLLKQAYKCAWKSWITHTTFNVMFCLKQNTYFRIFVYWLNLGSIGYLNNNTTDHGISLQIGLSVSWIRQLLCLLWVSSSSTLHLNCFPPPSQQANCLLILAGKAKHF